MKQNSKFGFPLQKCNELKTERFISIEVTGDLDV